MAAVADFCPVAHGQCVLKRLQLTSLTFSAGCLPLCSSSTKRGVVGTLRVPPESCFTKSDTAWQPEEVCGRRAVATDASSSLEQKSQRETVCSSAAWT